MKILLSFLFLVPLMSHAADFRTLEPNYLFHGDNEFTVDAEDVPGVTQVLIFSATFQAPLTQPHDPVTLSGGLWKYLFTIHKPGRAIQVWSRNLDRIPKSGVHMKLLVPALEFDIAMLEIAESYSVRETIRAVQMEPAMLALRIPGPGPYLMIAALDDILMSTNADYSFGDLAKTHIYLTNESDFSDPSLGEVTGIIGGLSFLRI